MSVQDSTNVLGRTLSRLRRAVVDTGWQLRRLTPGAEYSESVANASVFPEPVDTSSGPYAGFADWCRCSGSSDAHSARKTINHWYRDFPDRDGMILSRLRGNDDRNFLQAIDELNVFDLIPPPWDVRYEEDESSPDFRVYRSSMYVAGVEVCSLFPNKRFESEVSRNDRVVAEINRRVRPTSWYVFISSIRWTRQPRVSDIAAWLDKWNATLGAQRRLVPSEYPRLTYSSPEVDIEFIFIPRQRAAVHSSDRIIAGGPPVFGWGNHERRVRIALGNKAGGRYDHRDRPFAIFASVRDHADTEDLVNALYGDDVVRVSMSDPRNAVSDRRRNGFFAINAANPDGRNTRVSCVFALARGWIPGSHRDTKIFRFDNPRARFTFPDNLIESHFRFVARKDERGIRMEWEASREAC